MFIVVGQTKTIKLLNIAKDQNNLKLFRRASNIQLVKLPFDVLANYLDRYSQSYLEGKYSRLKLKANKFMHLSLNLKDMKGRTRTATFTFSMIVFDFSAITNNYSTSKTSQKRPLIIKYRFYNEELV